MHMRACIGRHGGRKSVSMGAAVIHKNHLLLSISVVFCFSLISLIFALLLSWAGKGNASLFVLFSFLLTVLGSIQCTSKKIPLHTLLKLIGMLRK